MDLIKLNANLRTTRGNGPARALRRENKMPAILYGPDMEPISVTIDKSDLEKAIKGSEGRQLLINLAIEGDEKSPYAAMLKELQTHPISRDFLHADFYHISMDRKIRVNVPITVTGKSVGVEMGGMLQIIRRELEVLCYPNEIPDTIELDITSLDMGESLHIEEIEAQGDIEFPHDVDFTVLTILSPKGKDADEEADEAEGEEEEGAETAEAEAAAE